MKKTKKDLSYIESIPLPQLPLWERFKNDRVPNTVEFEMTARCNNNCRQCYINLPASDPDAKKKEMTIGAIEKIAEQAASLGFLWWILTGGEPLLRKDFFEVYLMLKKKGFLVSVFTNAALVSDEHIRFFKKYPPRNIEVTIYGASENVYERVTRVRGSFKAFYKGLERLLQSGLNVQLKAMAMRSNLEEIPEIIQFCREHTNNSFRIDPFLHLRYDRDRLRNAEIKAERLAPDEAVNVERFYPEKVAALKMGCERTNVRQATLPASIPIITCGAGNNGFTLSYDGWLRLCMPLCHPDFMHDLKSHPLKEAWLQFIPRLLSKQTKNKELIERCGICSIRSLCQWCPAVSFLETGKVDAFIEPFCLSAQTRAKMVNKAPDDLSI